MARSVRPSARCAEMRPTTSSGVCRGRPSRVPDALTCARASRVRSLMRSRSNSATAARTCATSRPVGLDVSTSKSRSTSAHFSLSACSRSEPRCTTERDKPVELGCHQRPVGAVLQPAESLLEGRTVAHRPRVPVIDEPRHMPSTTVGLGLDAFDLSVATSA